MPAAEGSGIGRRRTERALAAALLGAAAGLLLARLLPASYTSTAEIGAAGAGGSAATLPAGEFAAPRLAGLKARSLPPVRLEALAAKYGIGAAKRATHSTAPAAARLGHDIVVASSAAGFSVSFTAGDAKTAQQLCSEAVSALVAQESKDLKREYTDARAASGTASTPMSEYVAAQVKEAKRALDELDAEVASFKNKHAGELAGPDREAAERKLAAIETELEGLEAALKQAMEQRTSLTEALFTQAPAAPQISKPAETPASEALERQLAAEQAQLVTLEARYTPDYPDVVKLKSDIEQLQEKIAEAKMAGGTRGTKQPDSAPPAGAALVAPTQTQIHEADLAIQEKTREQDRLQQEILDQKALLDRGALAEQEYRDLLAESANARSLYASLLAKQGGVQKDSERGALTQAATVRVIEPPSLPERAEFPNPIRFTLGGAGIGLGIGLAVIVLGETGDKSLRTPDDIERWLKLPTLAVIPAAGVSAGGGSGERRSPGEPAQKRGKKEEGVLSDA